PRKLERIDPPHHCDVANGRFAGPGNDQGEAPRACPPTVGIYSRRLHRIAPRRSFERRREDDPASTELLEFVLWDLAIDLLADLTYHLPACVLDQCQESSMQP